MQFQLLCESLCACYTVQYPECVLQFITEFGSREREFLLPCHCIEELVHICVMDEFPGLVRLEKFIQVKCEFLDIVIRKFYASFHPVTDNVGHLIGKKRKTR